jgi:hypothetical protein
MKHRSTIIQFAAQTIILYSCGNVRNSNSHIAENLQRARTEISAEPAMRLCRGTSEQPDGFLRLFSAAEIKTSLASYGIDGTEAITSMPSPINSIMLRMDSGLNSDIASADGPAQITYSPWNASGSEEAFRGIEMTVPFITTAGAKISMAWTFYQSRNARPPYELLTLKAELLSFGVSREEDKKVGYSVVTGTEKCEQDAYQGQQPGTAYGNGVVAGNERRPHPTTLSYSARVGFPIDLRVDGRSSIGGFDKTMTMAIDNLAITGLLSSPIIVTRPGAAAHAPGHHNWTDQIAVDLESADINDAQRRELAALSIKYLLLRPIHEAEIAELGLESGWNINIIEGFDRTRTASRRLGVVDLNHPN